MAGGCLLIKTSWPHSVPCRKFQVAAHRRLAGKLAVGPASSTALPRETTCRCAGPPLHDLVHRHCIASSRVSRYSRCAFLAPALRLFCMRNAPPIAHHDRDDEVSAEHHRVSRCRCKKSAGGTKQKFTARRSGWRSSGPARVQQTGENHHASRKFNARARYPMSGSRTRFKIVTPPPLPA